MDELLESDILQNSFLSKLSDQHLKQILNGSEKKSYRKGQTVVRQGGVADSFFLVLSGNLQVLSSASGKKKQAIATLSKGDTLGESSLFSGKVRSATVVASEDVSMLRIPLDVVNATLQNKDERGDFYYSISQDYFARQNSMNAKLTESYDKLKELSFNFCTIVGYLAVYSYAIALYGSFGLRAVNVPVASFLFALFGSGYLMYIYHGMSDKKKNQYRFGFTGIGRAMFESVIVLVVMLAVALVVKFSYLTWVLNVNQVTLFSPDKNAVQLGVLPNPAIHFGAYAFLLLVTCVSGFCQQLLIIAGIQIPLRSIFSFKFSELVCVLLPSLIYYSMFSYYGVTFPAIGFFSGCVWCALFLRHKTILPVCLCQGLFFTLLFYSIGV